MKMEKNSIRKIVKILNNPDEDGGFWLPNIQRRFVWGEDRIYRLFDSILREYPISTLLIWKTRNAIRRRRFIDNYRRDILLRNFYVPEDEKKKCLVLDGQQRLQSLFIGLCGSYDGRELYLNILSGETAAPEDIKFKFKFLDSRKAAFPWIKFKELVFTNEKQRKVIEDLKAAVGRPFNDSDLNKLTDNLNLVDRTFKMNEDAIAYQVLDDIDNPDLYTEDDVVEVFIRANSGGTPLTKSDLLFSLLSANWDVADTHMEDLLESLNRHGFEFDRDFILKTCLVLLNHGAGYDIRKFRQKGVREEIEEQWDEIVKAISDAHKFVREKTYIQCDKALPSYLVLIPLVYTRYHFPKSWQDAKDLDAYLLRCSLAGAFSGSSDTLLDALIKKLAELKKFNLDETFGVIRAHGRSLELTEERFWEMGYGSKTIHLLFNLWYHDFDHTPAYKNNLPQVDHIFPQSRLRNIKVASPETGRKVMKYSKDKINHLANCMLLTLEENGAGGKWDTLPDIWFAEKDKEYLEKHLIPPDPDLWKIDRFEDFIEGRKKLIQDKLKHLISFQTAG